MPKQRQRFAQQSNSFLLTHTRLMRWVVVALCCVLLAGCADSDSERRFANDPTLTEEAVATATVHSIDITPETPNLNLASPVSVTDLLAAPGGTPMIYIHSGKQIVAFTPPWSQPRVIWSAGDGRILAFSASATGNLVAILELRERSADQLSLVIVDSTGSVVREVTPVGEAGGGDAETIDTVERLSWSPDETRVVVAPPSGGLIAVPRTGEPVELIDPSRLVDPGTVVWSPGGDAIAFVAPVSPGKAGALFVATTAALPLDPIAVVPASLNGRRTIDRVSWRPDGEAVYYTVASTTNDPTFGGDLFEISSGGGAPTLIATASRVSPVSTITDFAISPDGKGVAFVVTVPRDDGGFADSLWLNPIGGSEFQALPVPKDERVSGLWWTSDGLVWQSNSAKETTSPEITLSRADSAGELGVVYRGPARGTTAATPIPGGEATPIAESSPEPRSSPHAVSGSPIAPPISSPEASPSVS